MSNAKKSGETQNRSYRGWNLESRARTEKALTEAKSGTDRGVSITDSLERKVNKTEITSEPKKTRRKQKKNLRTSAYEKIFCGNLLCNEFRGSGRFEKCI